MSNIGPAERERLRTKVTTLAGVSLLVLRGRVEFLGALPEARFVDEVWRAVPAAGDASQGGSE